MIFPNKEMRLCQNCSQYSVGSRSEEGKSGCAETVTSKTVVTWPGVVVVKTREDVPP